MIRYLNLRNYRYKTYWNNAKIDPVFRDSLWKNGSKNISIKYSDVSGFMKVEIEGIDKIVYKDNCGKVEYVIISIDGDEVMRFDFNKKSYPLYLFYGTSYSLCDKKYLNNNLIDFIIKYTELYRLQKIGLPHYEREQLKLKKNKQLAENNIDVLVKGLMKKAGYEYVLEKNETNCLLRIKMKRKQALEFSLPHKTFTSRIKKIIPTIELLKATMEQANVRFTLKGYGNHMKWK